MKADIKELKPRVAREVDTRGDELRELSLKIHSNPELGFKEEQASVWLTRYLESNGFSIERGICQLPTAFRAEYGQGKPVIAVLAEYDALPGLGHACGHNLIAASAVGAAVAARAAIDSCGGSMVVIGTPAEELYGGKAIMAERGAFDNLDAVMMIHPGMSDVATTRSLALHALDVEFFGQPSHAAADPEKGVNALEAMILSFNAINSLRQHIEDSARVHGIITDGGQAANVVPDHSAGTFLVRAKSDAYLEELKQRVIACFAGAAQATGTRLEYRWADIRYAFLRNNLALARLFQQNMISLGREVELDDPDRILGSTDMGNVTQVAPGIHAMVAIAPADAVLHSVQFARAAASETGIRALMDSAKTMAMTVVELVANPKVLSEIKNEFQKEK
ncbi:M20 family metallopeptidase [Chloroflexota bacterium]